MSILDSIKDFAKDHGVNLDDGLGLDDGSQLVALPLGELFRVVEQLVAEPWRKYHCCGHHRPGQAASPGLVAAGLNASVVKQAGFKHSRYLLRSII